MASRGEEDWRWKRKLTKPYDKQAPRSSRGRIAGGNSSATARGGVQDRARREQLIQEEEDFQRAGRTIPPGACPDTPTHLEEFDRGYIREYSKEVIMRHPVDTRAHPMLNYAGKQNVRKKDPRPIYFGFWCLMTNTTKLD